MNYTDKFHVRPGTVNHVLTAMNPQGCTVTGFKLPSKKKWTSKGAGK
jgi:polyphosphate kinase 2 (PPK2 family)